VNSDVGNGRGKQSPEFSTTRWSLILLGAETETDEEKARRALTQLCRTYWRPIFLFTCRRGFSQEDAQDLTQDFFAKIIETNWLRHADRTRGRFRSLLLKSLTNFLSDEKQKKVAVKRGGGLEFVRWDDYVGQSPSQLSISKHAFDTLPAELLYDLRWAATVVENALHRLAEECEKKGRLRLFDALSEHLAAERKDVSYATIASLLGVGEAMVKRQLHNLRQRYRWLLRDEVSRTVADPADVDDEIRHLCAALVAGEE
jgi:DNA-directed RNA polymerase specialized sigma24 family protein